MLGWAMPEMLIYAMRFNHNQDTGSNISAKP
jgi:hypothetical protein